MVWYWLGFEESVVVDELFASIISSWSDVGTKPDGLRVIRTSRALLLWCSIMLADARAHTMTCSNSDFFVYKLISGQVGLGFGYKIRSVPSRSVVASQKMSSEPSPRIDRIGFFSQRVGWPWSRILGITSSLSKRRGPAWFLSYQLRACLDTSISIELIIQTIVLLYRPKSC